MLNITRSLKYIIKKYNKILYFNIYIMLIIMDIRRQLGQVINFLAVKINIMKMF